MLRRFSLVLASLMTALAVAACGTISRPDDSAMRLSAQVWRPTDGVRIRASDAARIDAMSADIASRFGATSAPPTILALSGGGANGAFGAGVIVGWTETGRRPTFTVVTGVSTGALASPFVFLGPEWDDELRAVYTGGRTRRLLKPSGFAALVAPSLFSARSLSGLVDDYITPELLRQIAAEHAKGRRLFIVTTNLDAQEAVIWDMGLLASQGGPDALKLFRKIMLASASIPGVFTPVLIDGVGEDGRAIHEMHVDGGVNTPFLGIPESLLLTTNPERARPGTALYVLINGQVGRDYRVTRGTLPAILARSYDSMSKATIRTSLTANLAFAQRNGLRMLVAAIPDGVQASSLDFSPASMAALFEQGRALASTNDAWRRLDGDEGLDEALEDPEATAAPSPVH
jgi:hypothetical protein